MCLLYQIFVAVYSYLASVTQLLLDYIYYTDHFIRTLNEQVYHGELIIIYIVPLNISQ